MCPCVPFHCRGFFHPLVHSLYAFRHFFSVRIHRFHLICFVALHFYWILKSKYKVHSQQHIERQIPHREQQKKITNKQLKVKLPFFSMFHNCCCSGFLSPLLISSFVYKIVTAWKLSNLENRALFHWLCTADTMQYTYFVVFFSLCLSGVLFFFFSFACIFRC